MPGNSKGPDGPLVRYMLDSGVERSGTIRDSLAQA